MTKEIKITPPEGYEIDKENSTFDCIKFKPIVKKWRDSNPKVSGFYVGGDTINYFPLLDWKDSNYWQEGNLNVFAAKKPAKSAFAMAQISQIMANDERFGGMVTDEEWLDGRIPKYCIYRCDNSIAVVENLFSYHFLAFHTAKQRDLFLEENKDLVNDYLMVD